MPGKLGTAFMPGKAVAPAAPSAAGLLPLAARALTDAGTAVAVPDGNCCARACMPRAASAATIRALNKGRWRV